MRVKEIALLIGLLINSVSYANAPLVTEALLSYDSFSNATQKWIFKCSDPYIKGRWYRDSGVDPSITEHFSDYTKRTIYEGLLALAKVNPELVNKADKLIKSKVTFRIEESIPGAKAQTVLGKRGFTILISEDMAFQIAEKYAPERQIKKYTGYSENEQMQQTGLAYVRNSIFHEFLHAIGANNLSPDDHNKAVEFSFFAGSLVREDDVVFGCSNLIFPAAFAYHYVRNDGEFFSTKASCMACYLARSTSDLETYISTQPDEVQRAASECSDLKVNGQFDSRFRN
jgi:hypothetical protein